MANLLVDTLGERIVELVGTVGREAERRPPHDPGQEGDHRRVGSEMGMDVVDSLLAIPPQQDAGFGQVDQMAVDAAPRTPRTPAEPDGSQQCPQE